MVDISAYAFAYTFTNTRLSSVAVNLWSWKYACKKICVWVARVVHCYMGDCQVSRYGRSHTNKSNLLVMDDCTRNNSASELVGKPLQKGSSFRRGTVQVQEEEKAREWSWRAISNATRESDKLLHTLPDGCRNLVCNCINEFCSSPFSRCTATMNCAAVVRRRN